MFFYNFYFYILVFQNLLYVKEVNTPNCFGGVEYLGFEKLTFVPIQVFQFVCAFFGHKCINENIFLNSTISFLIIFDPWFFRVTQAKLVDLSLLSTTEMDWLNDYHNQVWEKASRFLCCRPTLYRRIQCQSISSIYHFSFSYLVSFYEYQLSSYSIQLFDLGH